MNRIFQMKPTNAIGRLSFYFRLAALTLALLSAFFPGLAYSADSVCARVKIEIKQELTLERQAFDATMKINNGLDTTSLDNVSGFCRINFHKASLGEFSHFPFIQDAFVLPRHKIGLQMTSRHPLPSSSDLCESCA